MKRGFWTALTIFAALAAPAAAEDLGLFPEGTRRALREAKAAADRGDWGGAAAAAQRSGDPVGPQMIRWLRLQDDKAADFDTAFDWLGEHRGWPADLAIQRVAEGDMPIATPAARVAAFFAGRAPLTGRGALLYADALVALKRPQEAAAVIGRGWVDLSFADSEETDAIARHGAALARHHGARLDRLLWDKRLSEARRMLDRVGPEARLLGQARLALLEDDGAADALVAALPANLKTHPGLSFARMIWREGKGRRADAEQMMIEASRTPGGLGVAEAWGPSRKTFMRDAYAAGNPIRALQIATPHGMGPGPDQAEADWFGGWLALRQARDPATARRLFEALFKAGRLPITRARAAYWAGEAAAAMGDAAGAREWRARAAQYPTTFYGQMASARLGRPPVSALGAPPLAPLGPPPPDWRFAARLGFALDAADDSRRAQSYLAALADSLRSDAALRGMGQAALDARAPHLGVVIGKKALTKGVLLPNAAFPKLELPARQGCGAKTEPALIHAVIRQESEFLEDARSPVGARGLMQLMPTTARLVGSREGLPYDAMSSASANIRIGACYLEELLGTYDGSIILAAAAYNAGPSRVRDWMSANGDPREAGVDPVDWVESIPFQETRNYVQRVMEGYYVYRFRFNDPAERHRLTANQ